MSAKPFQSLRDANGKVIAEDEEVNRWLAGGSPERPVTDAGETRWQSMDYTGRGGHRPARPTGPDRTGADLLGLRQTPPAREA
jgi:hypothetical protein